MYKTTITTTPPASPKLGEVTYDTITGDVNVWANNHVTSINSGGSWVTADHSHFDNFNNTYITSGGTEFEDYMPSPNIVDELADEYPALNIAYERFKSIYALSKGHHEEKTRKQND